MMKYFPISQYMWKITGKEAKKGRLRWLALIGLMLLSLLFRVRQLNDFVTTDEGYHWIERVERFRRALLDADWYGTSQTGHPGVTNMWLGSIGVWLADLAQGGRGDQQALGAVVNYLAWLRLPHALLEALMIGVALLILLRLLPEAVAWLGCFCWALSPYLIAHARVLHLDGLLTLGISFCVLLLLLWCEQRRWWAFAGSSVMLGFALLTKGPALIVLPFAGVVIWLYQLFVYAPAGLGWWQRGWQALWRALGWYAAWLALALVVVVMWWPALWSQPQAVLLNYWEEIAANGGRPNGDGQFFLGQAVGDPGVWFYPVANLFRSTPALLLGWLLLPVALWRAPDSSRRVIWVLGAFVVFWTAVMTLGPKKFDRYVLPTWPALCVLAAYGLAQLLLVQPLVMRRIAQLCLALVLAVELLLPVWYHPYYLSYYNPLLGGGPAAQRNLLIGWGEGMDQIGATIRERPDGASGQVLSALPILLQPFVPVPVRGIETLPDGNANYAVVYLESIQRAALPPVYQQIQQTIPVATVTIHGIEYARIYQLPRPFEQPVGALFGESLGLRGITLRREVGHLLLVPAWDVRARPPADYQMFVHLLDAQGQRVAQVDVAPGGGDDPHTSVWQPGRQIAVPIDLQLPNQLPAGRYYVVVGLYDSANGSRLGVQGGQRADPAVAGPHALVVATIDLP